MKTNDEKSLIIKLKDILDEKNILASKSDEIQHVSLTKEGIIPKGKRFDRDFLVKTENKKYKVTEKDDICYNPANLKFGVICRNKYGKAIFSPIYITFTIKPGYDPAYIEYLVTNDKFIKKALKYQEGTVYERMAVKPSDLLNMKVTVVDIKTQEKIGKMLQALDELILLYKEKLTALETYNKGLQQKLFSQSVRFKRSDGSSYPEWGNKALSAIGHFYGGLSGKTKEDFGKGTGKYITYMNVYKNVFIDNNTLELVEIKDNEKQNKVEYGDLLFTQSSETIEEVGLTSVYLFNDKPFLNSFCMGFRLDNIEATFPKYLGYLMRTDFIRKQIMREGQGISRINLSGNRILNIAIKIPKSLEEQQKIADVLSCFDELIQNTKEKIETLKTLKYGLLQHVFN